MEYTPILNETKQPSFKYTRGIRQGDPLSPYLFIMAMEYFSISIAQAINFKTWKTFKLWKNDLEISHLLFADDVLLFEKANNSSIHTIKAVIQDFYQSYGMEINLEKSKLRLSPSIRMARKNDISNFMQIPLSSNLGTYLGYMLKTNYKNSDFEDIILKI